jgi:heme A synthase
MPEGPEVDTDKLHETIHEELEREGSGLLRGIALTTALLAALAAIAALQAGATVNEALVLKTEATRLQAEASDQWAYYQAKGIKGAVHEASRAGWLANGKTPPPELAEATKRYAAEQVAIQKEARAKEQERDAKSTEADHLLHRHNGFANSVAIFQVAIALGAVAALTRNRLIWLGSLVLGAAGVVILGITHLG